MSRAWGAKLRVLYDANRQEGNRLGAALAYLWGFGQLVSRKLDFGFWEIFLHMLCAMRFSASFYPIYLSDCLSWVVEVRISRLVSLFAPSPWNAENASRN